LILHQRRSSDHCCKEVPSFDPWSGKAISNTSTWPPGLRNLERNQLINLADCRYENLLESLLK
jgi:hypothetical protein